MRIAVAGAGAWGTALANVAAASAPAVLWARSPAAAAAIESARTNAAYLPGVPLHERVRVTADLGHLREADAVLLAAPAQATRAMAEALAAVLLAETPLVLCAKGLERGSNLFLSDAVRAARPDSTVAILSGPSFAADVARGLPTAVTLAASDSALARRLAEALATPAFRVYHGTDLRGAEIGGAAKNVLAIACGAVVGRGLGESARAALIARGFAEMMRFAESHGAKAETLMGLSGLGDLVLTASSPQSRNFAFGLRLGQGIPPGAAAGGRLAEGALTAPVLVAMAAAAGVEMPVAAAVDAVIAGRLTLPQAIDALMQRPLRREH